MMGNNILPKLKIANIVFCGKFPFEKSLNIEMIEDIKQNTLYQWQVVNEEICPILQTRIPLGSLKTNGKPRIACISIWVNGTVIITGTTNRKIANKFYEAIYYSIFERENQRSVKSNGLGL